MSLDATPLVENEKITFSEEKSTQRKKKSKLVYAGNLPKTQKTKLKKRIHRLLDQDVTPKEIGELVGDEFNLQNPRSFVNYEKKAYLIKRAEKQASQTEALLSKWKAIAKKQEKELNAQKNELEKLNLKEDELEYNVTSLRKKVQEHEKKSKGLEFLRIMLSLQKRKFPLTPKGFKRVNLPERSKKELMEINIHSLPADIIEVLDLAVRLQENKQFNTYATLKGSSPYSFDAAVASYEKQGRPASNKGLLCVYLTIRDFLREKSELGIYTNGRDFFWEDMKSPPKLPEGYLFDKTEDYESQPKTLRESEDTLISKLADSACQHRKQDVLIKKLDQQILELKEGNEEKNDKIEELDQQILALKKEVQTLSKNRKKLVLRSVISTGLLVSIILGIIL